MGYAGIESVMKLLLLSTFALAAFAASNPAEARRIQKLFIAPCCWSEDVAVHRSGAAEEMRVEIAKMVAEGRSEAQIVDHYVAIHGERILLEPRGARSFWLTITPVLVTLAALAALALIVRHMIRRRPSPQLAAAAGPPPDVPGLDEW